MSKITFAGAGISAVASSSENIAAIRKGLTMQTIGPDKVNQIRHAQLFRTASDVSAHMRKHAELLRPKFAAVESIFKEVLSSHAVASWTTPYGGYFVSLDTPDGCAKETIQLATEAGVKLTAAGATFPYGKDPSDSNIRIAPSLPPLEQVEKAMQVVACCVLLVCARKGLLS